MEFYILALDRTTAPFFDALEAAVEARRRSCACCSTTSRRVRSPGYYRTIRRLKKIGRAVALDAAGAAVARAGTSAPTCATTARSSSSTASSPSPDRRTSSTPATTSAATSGAGCTGRTSWCASRARSWPGINALFVTDWYSETDELLLRETDTVPSRRRRATRSTCQVVPSGPGFDGENNLRLFNALLYAAAGTHHHHQPVLRARRIHALRDHHGGAERPRRSSCSSPRWATSASSTTRSAATTRRCCAPACASGCTSADRAARQALHDRRRGRGDRLEQHGHALVQPQPRDLGHGARRVVREGDARVEDAYRAASRELTLEEWMQRPLGRQGARQHRPAHLGAAVAAQLRAGAVR